jgi:hypothetical protein
MATTSKTPPKEAPASTEAVLTCPECGKTFTRAAALGAHRKLKHGVAGASANATRNRRSVGSSKRNGSAPTRRRSATSATSNGAGSAVDRDALLRALFPNGIPPRLDVIAQVNSWLDEADRLAGSR